MTGLKIGGVPEHFNLPWRLGIEEGLFKEIGLDLHWSDMSGGTGQMIRGLESGSIDVAVLLTEGVTKAILQGLEAKIIDLYVVSPLRWGVHVPCDSPFERSEDLEGKVFAISRKGSGSHLMSYVMAEQHNWDKNNMKFNVVGDVYGGLWALENNEAQIFLWEKYTTHPFTEQKKCRFIDEVITPWPCFLVAARKDVEMEHGKLLQEMCSVVHGKAAELKKNENSAEVISWRYNLSLNQTQHWLKETEWNLGMLNLEEQMENIIPSLLKYGILTTEETENWKNRIF